MGMIDVGVFHRVPGLAVIDPATGEAIGHVPACAAPEAHDAVTAARAAHTAWARTATDARGSLLKAAARRLREHAREIAELQTRETGTPLSGVARRRASAGSPPSRPTPSSARWTARPPREVTSWCVSRAASSRS